MPRSTSARRFSAQKPSPYSRPTTSHEESDAAAPEKATRICVLNNMRLDSVKTKAEQDATGCTIQVSSNKDQNNAMAQVPGLDNTWAITVDNPQSWNTIYSMMPGKKLSVIVAVAPDTPIQTTKMDWSVLKGPAQSSEAPARYQQSPSYCHSPEDEGPLKAFMRGLGGPSSLREHKRKRPSR
ncbi:hypothetical protein NW762_008878 [Fusarium torreyae]|uniref:Uncharacterized protein n=1 Tax=Fusarium torreyae TaxID=1237075 RepID=A0A9W8RXF0_9HYPO|nr:hypothetical protein NW762_008878 [Fusarium torreyae]